MNILFIMYDQLRYDYLSCAGHPHLQTPNFDRVAAKRCAVQKCLCAVADLRFLAHELSIPGATCHRTALTGTGFRLRVGEMTMGDHLQPRRHGMLAPLARPT